MKKFNNLSTWWLMALFIVILLFPVSVPAYADSGGFLSSLLGAAGSMNPFSAIFGGITGAIGSICSHWMELKKVREQNSHTQAMRKLDLEAMDKEYAFQERSAELELEETEEAVRGEAHTAAIKAEGESFFANVNLGKPGKFMKGFIYFIFGCGELFRKLLRPGLTIYITVKVVTLMNMFEPYFKVMFNDPTKITSMYVTMVNVFIYSFTMVISFWFMGRKKFADTVEQKLFK